MKKSYVISLLLLSALALSGCTSTASENPQGGSTTNEAPSPDIEQGDTTQDNIEVDSETELEEKNPEGGTYQNTPGINSAMEFPIMVSIFTSSCLEAQTYGATFYSPESSVNALILAPKESDGTNVGFISASEGQIVSNNLNDFDICLISNAINLIVDPDYTDISAEIISFETNAMGVRFEGIGLSSLSDRLTETDHIELLVEYNLDNQIIETIKSIRNDDSDYNIKYKIAYGEGIEYEAGLSVYSALITKP